MANFPTSLDSFTNPTTNDFLNSPNHVDQHSQINDAVEALEAKLGITASTPTSGKLLRGTGAGTSEWDKDAPSGTIVGTTDSQTLTNKTLTSPTINTAIINNPTLKTDTVAEFTAAAGVTVDGLLIKDSKLATNNSVVTSNITDDAITAAKIDWASTGAGAGIWWEELGRHTLGSAADALSVTSIAARKHLMIIVNVIASGSVSHLLRFNNDSSSNYAWRVLTNGTNASGASATSLFLDAGTTSDIYSVINCSNIATQEKFATAITMGSAGAGAATVPSQRVGAGKWVNTAAQINRVDVVNSSAGDYAAGSELIVLGHN